jgi:hypothetical protein
VSVEGGEGDVRVSEGNCCCCGRRDAKRGEAFDVSNKRRAVDTSGISLIEQTKASGIYRAKPNSRKPDARPLCLAGFSPVPDAMKSSPTVK